MSSGLLYFSGKKKLWKDGSEELPAYVASSFELKTRKKK
jgi:hypothetical protein